MHNSDTGILPDFLEIRFPPDISYGITGGPEYSTTIVSTAGGFEQRNCNWLRPRNRYNAAHGIKNQEQMHELLVFFRLCKGKALGFRFKDWSDYKAESQFMGEGDGNKTTFQLIKSYQLVGSDITNCRELREITKPVVGTIKIYYGAHIITDGFKADTTSGIISFKTPPSVGTMITADFEFDVPVRFDTDHLAATQESFGTYSWEDIPLIEIRP